MTRYVSQRILSLFPVLLGVTLLVFLVMQLAPGDPAQIMLGPKATETSLAQLRHELGLDQPLHVQYALTLPGGMVELTVRDDGIGMPRDHDLEESHGVGLLGMRHRVERLGGHFAIRRLKHGTKIVAAVPA